MPSAGEEEEEDDEDEETLQLKLQAIEARLKLKKLQNKSRQDQVPARAYELRRTREQRHHQMFKFQFPPNRIVRRHNNPSHLHAYCSESIRV